MKLIVIDFESYYSREYSLSKLSTDAYILDPRFETIGVGVRVAGSEPVWVTENIEEYLHSLDLPNNAVLCWHTQFDGFILTQRYGITAGLWLDGLSMARAMLPHLRSHSLANVAKYLGVGEKGTEVLNALGKRRADFTPTELAAYGEYCKTDVQLTRAITGIFHKWGFPKHEYEVIDMVIRMFVEPTLYGDAQLFDKLYHGEVARKELALERAAVSRETIMSNDKFADALRNLFVDPPTKISPRTGKVAYAFAKTDKAFTALLDHDNADVQALVAARLGVKTTISETRAARLRDSSNRGALPIYLNYSGAKVSHRLCLTGNTQITVLRDGDILDILLEHLKPDDLVWDGVEFVFHGGLVDRGVKGVITHDGITGTPDHRTYCDEAGGSAGTTVALLQAAERGYTITRAGVPSRDASALGVGAGRPLEDAASD